MAIFIPRFLRSLRDVDTSGVADGDALTYDSGTETWIPGAGGGGGDLTDAVILAPASSARNVIQPTAGAVIAAIVKAHAAQSVDLMQWQLSSGALAWGLSKGGHEILADLAAPADGDVPTGQRWQWYDDSVGAPKLRFTQRDSAGTLFKGRALASDYDTGQVLIAADAGVAAIDYVLQLDIPDRDIITGSGYGPYFTADGEQIWAVDAWGSMYLSGPFVGLEIAKQGGVSATKILTVTQNGLAFYGGNADTTTLFATDTAFDSIGAFGEKATQQTAASISDLWTALKAYGWLDSGSVAPTIGGAPTTATYITQTPDAGLSAEQALSALATGLVKNTTGTGVLSIGVANTDYAAAAHASRHENGGADEISVAGLSGLLADAQTPTAHKTSHEDGGADEINLTGLSGAPADTVNKSLYDANTVLAADSDNTPAALTMGASTILARLAAGNIKAASVAEIRTLLGDTDATHFLNGAGAMVSSWPYAGRGYKTGLYYIHDTTGVISFAANVIAQDVVTAVPFVVRKTTTFDRIAVFQGANGTATTVHRLGIYSDDGNAYPGARLLDAGTVAGDAGGSVIKEITISQSLDPGLYWLVHVNQVAAGGSTFNSSSGSILPHWMAHTTAAINGHCYRQTGVTGALGTPFTTTPVINATGTAMWLRAA